MTCRELYECVLKQPVSSLASSSKYKSCVSSCNSQIASKSAECGNATAAFGTCGSGVSCDEFTAGKCKAESDAASVACNGAIGDAGPKDGSTGTCSRFDFKVSGLSCGSSCSAFQCSCPGGFPISLTKCTSQGCLSGGNCTEICKAGVADALSCASTFSVGGKDAGPDACVSKTCSQIGAQCGTFDNCGTLTSCPGACTSPQSCGGGGQANKCGCTPTTCAGVGANCGTLDNGCGTLLTCSPGCSGNQWCAGGGFANKCGCTPGSVATGVNAPSSGVDIAGIGVLAWSNGSQISLADDPGTANPPTLAAYASVTSTSVTHWLAASQYKFDIPAAATITGIEVSVKRRAGSFATSVSDNAVRLIKGGTIGTTDRSIAAAWPLAYGTATYGSSSDLWGLTWTPAEINDPSFGASLSAKGTASDRAIVDQMTVKVYFSITCP